MGNPTKNGGGLGVTHHHPGSPRCERHRGRGQRTPGAVEMAPEAILRGDFQSLGMGISGCHGDVAGKTDGCFLVDFSGMVWLCTGPRFTLKHLEPMVMYRMIYFGQWSLSLSRG